MSGDVFTLNTLPYTSPLLNRSKDGSAGLVRAWEPSTNGHATPKLEELPDEPIPWKHQTPPPATTPPVLPHLPKLAGLMSARAILANPALYAGHDTCPWEAVELFMNKAARAPLHLKLVLHHLTEMCGPGMGSDKRSLLSKKERIDMLECRNMCDLIDFLDDKMSIHMPDRKEGMRRIGNRPEDTEKG